MVDATLAAVDLTVEPFGRFFRIELPGHAAVEGSIGTIMNGVFRLLANGLAEDARGSPILHAAIATIEGQRFVFLGDKGFGKTTLMLSLIEQGIAVEGDEHVVVTHSGAITRPRRLHVKESSLDLVPALRDAIRSSPSETDWTGNRIYACSPSFRGGSWAIAEVPIDHLVFVEPNFGGSSVLSPLSRDEAFARLLETTFMPSVQQGPAAVRLRKLCVDAGLWRLQAGNLDHAHRHLRKVAEFAKEQARNLHDQAAKS
ncbi:hypothetical protein [Mesorhizobium sp. KR9-304]|uniref:hypothetical protein n=1 Tax=Mesorhizobium sp. KR9-304 TaxID=3156614 RepID=UPI0032B40FB0